MTTMIPELADIVGYSARDGLKRARVRTAVGSEDLNYEIRSAERRIFVEEITDGA